MRRVGFSFDRDRRGRLAIEYARTDTARGGAHLRQSVQRAADDAKPEIGVVRSVNRCGGRGHHQRQRFFREEVTSSHIVGEQGRIEDGGVRRQRLQPLQQFGHRQVGQIGEAHPRLE